MVALCRFPKAVTAAYREHAQRSKRVPEPVSLEVWGESNTDKCCLVDSYFERFKVCFTTSINAEFIDTELRKAFSKERMPQTLVTDNGNGFIAENISSWLVAYTHTSMIQWIGEQSYS